MTLRIIILIAIVCLLGYTCDSGTDEQAIKGGTGDTMSVVEPETSDDTLSSVDDLSAKEQEDVDSVIKDSKEKSVFKGMDCSEMLKKYGELIDNFELSGDGSEIKKFKGDHYFNDCKNDPDYSEEFDSLDNVFMEIIENGMDI